MKEQILKIAQELEQGTITETEAQNLLLGLFGVIKTVCAECNSEITFRILCSKCFNEKLFPQTVL